MIGQNVRFVMGGALFIHIKQAGNLHAFTATEQGSNPPPHPYY